MLPTFVIGLREGLEASLIVGIIAAFVVQRHQEHALRAIWIGVGLAMAICAAVAIALSVLDESLPFRQRELLEGTLALVAVVGVTYMVVWMRRHAREMKRQLEAHAESALLVGSTFALVGMAFIAVLREGLETAIFMLAAFQSSLDPLATGSGAVLGVGVAIVLGYLLYRGGVRINLAQFFRVTGFVLVLVAAGLVSTAVHSLAEAGLVDVLQQPALDLSWLISPATIQGAVLTGMFGFQPVPTVAELLVWFAYAVPVGAFVLWPQSRPAPRPAVGEIKAA